MQLVHICLSDQDLTAKDHARSCMNQVSVTGGLLDIVLSSQVALANSTLIKRLEQKITSLPETELS